MTYYKYMMTGDVLSEEEYRDLIGEGFDLNPLQNSLMYGSKEGYIDKMLMFSGYGFLPLQDGEITGSYCVGIEREEEFDVFYHTENEEAAYDLCEEYNEIFKEEFKEEAEKIGNLFTVLALRKW